MVVRTHVQHLLQAFLHILVLVYYSVNDAILPTNARERKVMETGDVVCFGSSDWRADLTRNIRCCKASFLSVFLVHRGTNWPAKRFEDFFLSNKFLDPLGILDYP